MPAFSVPAPDPLGAPSSVPTAPATTAPATTAPATIQRPVPHVDARDDARAESATIARPRPRFPTDAITLRPWSDPLLDRLGHDPRSTYAERFWLPILGPSTLMLLRRLAAAFDEQPDAPPPGPRVEVMEIAGALGMGAKHGPSAPFFRTIDRVISFGFAQLIDDTTLAVRTHLPTLTRRQLGRLPASLRAEHHDWTEQREASTVTPSETEQMRLRSRALALSLIQLGEDVDTTERQLHRWRFHPAIAHDAVRWATAQHEARRAREHETRRGPAAESAMLTPAPLPDDAA